MISRITMAAALVAMVGISTTMMVTRSNWAGGEAPAPTESKPDSKPASALVASPTSTGQAAGRPAPEAPEVPEVVMARVGERNITVAQFMKYITQDTRLVLKARTVPGKTEILREMILDRLLEEAMAREGLLPKDRAPKPQEYMQAYQQLASRHFPKSDATPAEEELYRYYQQHPEFFGVPAMVRISQIQFRIPEKADDKTKAEVRAKAEDALKRLRAGEAFPALAEALTENPQAKVAKGDLGFLQPEKDAWLNKAVEGLAVGQVSAVLESPVGYEILLLQDKRDAMVAPYANVRDSVLQRIRQEAQAKMREDYAWKLAGQVGVTVELPELKGAIPPGIPGSAVQTGQPKAAAPSAPQTAAPSAPQTAAPSAPQTAAPSAGQAATPSGGQTVMATPEQLQALKDRVNRYWAAREAGDVRTLYDLESAARPGGWLKLEQAMTLQGLPVRRVKVDEVRIEGEKAITRIRAEVTIGTMGWVPQTINDPWVLLDGQWYHETYRP
jgi:parvulin-like peptidyl-prolyl isomerase